jgi:hypothetical protein
MEIRFEIENIKNDSLMTLKNQGRFEYILDIWTHNNAVNRIIFFLHKTMMFIHHKACLKQMCNSNHRPN